MSEESDDRDLSLQRAYQLTFGSASGQTVLLDLMKECKFRRPTNSVIDEGKRQAFLRIMNFLALTPDQLFALYRGQSQPSVTGEQDNAA